MDSRWRDSFGGRTLLALACAAVMLALTIAAATVGCREKSQVDDAQAAARAQRQRQIIKANTLIKSVTSHLKDLPNIVSVDLTPPTVVLDATSSVDGQDVMAVVSRSPGSDSPFLNTLTIPNGNANFKALGVRAGDVVKCFLLPDRASRTRLIETGELDSNTLTFESVDVEVATAIGPNRLLISEGLRLPARIALDLSTRVADDFRKEFVNLGLPEDFIEQLIEQLDDAGHLTADGVALPAELIQALPGVAWPFRIEIWRTDDARMREINASLARYADSGKPPLGWEPSADQSALAQLTDWLNQWVRSREPPADWKPTDLVATLPEGLRDDRFVAPGLADDALSAAAFADHEGRLIEEAVWRRDISRWASGDRFDPVERATELFDWLVRNVTLTDDPRVSANRPWQTLIYGRGTPAQRAWVFAGLCQQLKLPVVVLEVPVGDDGQPPWLWCGLLSGGKLHLFDPQLGLPITNEEDSVATLAQVQEDGQILRRLDLEDAKYPPDAEAAKRATACVVADAFALSWRASELQKQFSANSAVALFVDADAIADEVRSLPSVENVRLWPEPFLLLRERLRRGANNRQKDMEEFLPFAWRPRLWKARMLHLRGELETAADARRRGDALYDPVNDHRAAGALYMHRNVRPEDGVLDRLGKLKSNVYRRAKRDATYWLALLSYEHGDYGLAREWLDRVSVENDPTGRQYERVRYNKARALESLGEYAAAAELLEGSQTPQRHGDRLRARGLRERASGGE